MPARPFDCKLCNECCTGEGGIYLETSQLPAAARLKGLGVEEFKRKYLRPRGEVWEVICDERGVCSLLGEKGCTIHQAKPKICELWPFFPGILRDQAALNEAKLSCPGIHPQATCEELRRLYNEQNKEGRDG